MSTLRSSDRGAETALIGRVGDLYCFGPDAQDVWRYLPRLAGVRRDPTGRPEVTFTDLGEMAFLMLTATWAAPPEAVEELRAQVAWRLAGPDPGGVRVAMVELREVSARVLWFAADSPGAGSELTRSPTSGIPPYDALCNLTLEGGALEAARAAFNGEPGRLIVRYEALRPTPVAATAVLSVSAARLPGLLDQLAQAADARTAVDRAVQDGVATVRIDSTQGDPGVLLNDLYEQLLAQAARSLSGAIPGLAGDLEVRATLERSISEPVAGLADLATLHVSSQS
ncbi:MAG: hypothetical protein ACOYEV_09565 [Candidatus Nanopelagicales bacterium]